MDKTTRQQVGRLIAGIVASDFELDEREDAFLERVLDKFEIAPEVRGTLAATLDRSEAAATMRRLPAASQAAALTLLIEAAAADGNVSDEEREYLHAIAEELGVPVKEIDKRLAAQLAR